MTATALLPSPACLRYNAPMRQGFTLLELSIVLVIIGLIVGGVVAGQSLIRSASIKKDLTRVEQIQQAVLSFKYKYNALPGDIPNASEYWGVATSCTSMPTPSNSGACNGNGDGMITTQPSFNWVEMQSIFQHLSKAGMVPGEYRFTTGSIGQGGVAYMAQRFPMSSAFYPSTFQVYYMQCSTIWGGWLAGCAKNKHYITIQGEGHYPNTSSNDRNAYIPSEDAFSIDIKLDDGKAMSGNVLGWSHNYQIRPGEECITANNNTGVYILGDGHKCDLFFAGSF